MGQAAEAVVVRAPIAEVWEFYFQPETWPSWVDGFGRVESSSGYPDEGGTLRWRSGPAGRGSVSELVVEHQARRLHRVEFSDELSEGELSTTFAIETGPGGEPATRITQEMDYRLRRRGPLTFLTDALFVRPQVARSLGRSLERSLARLRAELEASV